MLPLAASTRQCLLRLAATNPRPVNATPISSESAVSQGSYAILTPGS